MGFFDDLGDSLGNLFGSGTFTANEFLEFEKKEARKRLSENRDTIDNYNDYLNYIGTDANEGFLDGYSNFLKGDLAQNKEDYDLVGGDKEGLGLNISEADIDSIIAAYSERQDLLRTTRQTGGKSNTLLTGNTFR